MKLMQGVQHKKLLSRKSLVKEEEAFQVKSRKLGRVVCTRYLAEGSAKKTRKLEHQRLDHAAASSFEFLTSCKEVFVVNG